MNPARIHVTVPVAYAPRRRGCKLYRVWRRHLPLTDQTEVDGIAATRAERSIRDCVTLGTDPAQLELACRTGLREGYLDDDQYEVLLARVQSAGEVDVSASRPSPSNLASLTSRLRNHARDAGQIETRVRRLLSAVVVNVLVTPRSRFTRASAAI